MSAMLRFNPLALQDLKDIQRYISEELENPGAGLSVVQRILGRIEVLREFPEAGPPLSSVIRIRSSYRYLTCENYLAFYQYKDDVVSVYRVLYRKRDYIRVLFD